MEKNVKAQNARKNVGKDKKMRKVALRNLGCKVNAYETEAMQELLERSGYEIVPFAEGADIYIINTCTVTNMADRKSRQMLHRAKKTESAGRCGGSRLLCASKRRKYRKCRNR